MSIPHKTLLSISTQSYQIYSCKVREVECLVIQMDDFQVVAPRGTEGSELIGGQGWRDVIRDLRVIPWYDRRVGWSHAGFLKGARGLVDKGLYGMLKREIPIVFTGHSLGGAIAINAAKILDAEGFNIDSVVTFGAPRTLTKGAVKNFQNSGIEIVEYSNRGDPIPDVPFRWWGYRHINEVHTSRDPDGYSALKNHLIEFYQDAFRD